MGNKIKVKSALKTEPDGGHRVAIHERDDRHEDGEIFIADEKVYSVTPTAGVMAAMTEGRLVEVRGNESASAPESEDEDSLSKTELMKLTREELDDRANEAGVQNPESMKTKEEVADAILEA